MPIAPAILSTCNAYTEPPVITYGKPLNFDEYKNTRKEKETIDKVTDEIMDNIVKLAT